jgi:predicted kinase
MILYLVRGLPGSGKSTLARKLVGDENVLEADDFFVGPDGYRYDATKIKDAHMWCQRETEDFIADRDIAVANTFTQRWEMEPYYRLKENYDINIVEITVSVNLTNDELAARCVHGVPVETIQRMRERWQQ